MVVMSTQTNVGGAGPNIKGMKGSAPRPNSSPEELRRDFLATDPADRIRQGLRLSRFGNLLRQATQRAERTPGR